MIVVNFSKKIQSINDAENMVVAVDALYQQNMKFPRKEKISLATTDPKIAANFSDYLIFVCPSFAQEILFNDLVPHLKNGQVIILMPGNYGSLVIQSKLEKSIYKNLKLTFVDAITIPWATQLIKKNKIAILGIKEYLPLSIWPKENSDKIFKDLQSFLPIPPKLLPNLIMSCLEILILAGNL